MDLSSVYVTF